MREGDDHDGRRNVRDEGHGEKQIHILLVGEEAKVVVVFRCRTSAFTTMLAGGQETQKRQGCSAAKQGYRKLDYNNLSLIDISVPRRQT